MAKSTSHWWLDFNKYTVKMEKVKCVALHVKACTAGI